MLPLNRAVGLELKTMGGGPAASGFEFYAGRSSIKLVLRPRLKPRSGSDGQPICSTQSGACIHSRSCADRPSYHLKAPTYLCSRRYSLRCRRSSSVIVVGDRRAGCSAGYTAPLSRARFKGGTGEQNRRLNLDRGEGNMPKISGKRMTNSIQKPTAPSSPRRERPQPPGYSGRHWVSLRLV